MWISFSKYAGCGNDFILIDNRNNLFPIDNHDFISKMCKARTGISADGIILLENSGHADFRMRIFNPDGKETEMCGNGIRCLFKFIHELGYQEPSFSIETMHSQLQIAAQDDHVRVEMGDPMDMRWNFNLSDYPHHQQIHFLNTGVPHAVLFFDEIEKIDMFEIGRQLRHHPVFGPQGANINAASIDKEGRLWVRTFERGVEAETLACGTGATAVAIAAAKIKGLKSPIRVYPRSQEVLEVGFEHQEDKFSQVTLTGPATFVFKGSFLCCV